MLFTVICNDKAGSTNVRAENRDAHLAFLAQLGDGVKLGGPMMDSSASIMNGSLLIVEADNLEAARAMMADDPYALAGLFESVEIRPWKWAVKPPA